GCGERDRLRDRVVQSGRAARLDAAQLRRDVLLVACPWMHELRAVIEPVKEDLVVLTEQVEEEPLQRLLGGSHLLAFHAPAGVEDDSQADGYALGGEVGDRALPAVLIDPEVLLTETGHEPTAAVAHGRGDVDQLDARAEPERLLF